MKRKILVYALCSMVLITATSCSTTNTAESTTQPVKDQTDITTEALTTKSTEASTITPTETSQSTEINTEQSTTTEELKSFGGLIEKLVELGFITPDGDNGSFADALGAINGYRYYNLETLETTEIYEFDSAEKLQNLNLNGTPVTPDKTIGTYAIFSENPDLIAAIEEYLQ